MLYNSINWINCILYDSQFVGVKRIPVTFWNYWHLYLLLDLRGASRKNVISFLLSSKTPYSITNTVEWDTFESPIALLYIPCSVAWLFGFIVNHFFYKDHTAMPATNLIACAIMVCISTHTYMVAIYLTNFPIVMLVKSCNIVSVVLVGVFCSRVKDKNLALGPKKIIIACLISSGIILYNFGGD